MNAFTTMSDEGQMVIAKDVRDRLRFAAGDQLEVVELPDGVLLRKQTNKSGESFETITARFAPRGSYDGPPVTIEEMNESIAEITAKSGETGDR